MNTASRFSGTNQYDAKMAQLAAISSQLMYATVRVLPRSPTGRIMLTVYFDGIILRKSCGVPHESALRGNCPHPRLVLGMHGRSRNPSGRNRRSQWCPPDERAGEDARGMLRERLRPAYPR